MKAFVEGYGCSLNKADTQTIKGFLQEQGINLAELKELKKGDIAVINACAVKETTEKRMLSRIEWLFNLSKKQNFKLIVFGCISKISPEKIRKISSKITILPPALEELSGFLGIKRKEFSPAIQQVCEGIIAIIPICRGCLGECSYCAVKKARGNLKSYSIKELTEKFEKEIKAGKKEVWLTAQDCGCYGFDIGTNIVELLKELLKIEGNYKVRLGMMNVKHLKIFLKEFLQILKDERIFKFLHLPLQSGSNRILQLMNRNYTVEEWLEITLKAREKFPEITIATDIIVGFPTETEKEFNQTLKALEKAKVDLVNISRFGKRPFTKASYLKEVSSFIKKERSRKATEVFENLAKERNSKMLEKIENALVDEKGIKGGFIGRTSNYKPVVLKKVKFGEFYRIKITGFEKSFLKAEKIND